MKKYTKIHKFRSYLIKIYDMLNLRSLRYRLLDGSPFIYHPGDNLSSLIFIGRAYEPLETNFIRKFLVSGDIAIDAGANIGFMTKTMSYQVGDQGCVYAIEPSADTFIRLQETIKIAGLKNVIPCCFALWKSEEVMGFQISTSGADAQQSFAAREKIGPDAVRWPVCACTLGSMMSAATVAPGKVAFVKIDVEGVEPAVLDGARSLLESENPPVIMIEYNVEALTACGFTGKDLMERLQSTHDCYFTPLCWPPWWTDQVDFGTAQYDTIPPECNLIAMPRKGIYAQRGIKALRSGS